MNKAKHTPGPWKHIGLHGGQENIVGMLNCGCKATIARAWYDEMAMVINEEKYGNEVRANAALIAAAPEMLVLLKRAHEYMLSMINLATIDQETRRLEIEMRAAIAKAEGNQ